MPQVVRVLPDVSGLDKLFDYSVPENLAALVDVGSVVRFDLNGRRTAGWVVETDPAGGGGDLGYELRELSKVSSVGPPGDVVELARWCADRWCGRWSRVLKAASPRPMVDPRRRAPSPITPGGSRSEAESSDDRFFEPGVSVVRLTPAQDATPLILAAASRGNTLVVVGEVSEAAHLAAKVRRGGARVSLLPRGWDSSRGGGVAIGARNSVWAPIPDLRTILVVDEGAETLQDERNPTWHARDVALERARRLGIPCLLVTVAPSPAAVAASDRLVTPARSEERGGWPLVRVADRRRSEPGRHGLFSPELVDLLRGDKRVVCVLNRKGRAVMLACAACGELVRTADGENLMVEQDGRLVCPSTGEERPRYCGVCASTKLKRLRLGIGRAREELEALAREPVGEVSAGGPDTALPPARILVGTTAVLHQVTSADAVVFLDFDQEILAHRYRAAETAMDLLVRAARLVGPRAAGGTILIQTRNPEHRVIRSAVRSDPSVYVREELEVRRAMGFPPFGAIAEVSGAGAEGFLEPLTSTLGVTVLGPRPDGRFLVRADSPEELAEAIGGLKRTKERVRVAVDPPRA